MQGSPGLLASSIRRQIFGREVWTFSVWLSKDELMQFVRSPQHREAIAAASDMLETFETRRRVLPRGKLPGSWDEALALFAEEPAVAQTHPTAHRNSVPDVRF